MIVHAVVASPVDAERAVAAGATVVQLRLKEASRAERVAAARAVRHLPVILVINDDVGAAIDAGADGVHLGQTDGGWEAARAAGLLFGISVGCVAEVGAAEAAGARYLGAGPVWATPSKADAGPAIGLDGLRAVCAAASIPVIAIGGVDAANAAACIAAGAAGVAVVRAAADPAVRGAVDGALGAAATRR